MEPQKYRWSRVYESSEEELVDLLKSQNVAAERWHADEFHDFGEQAFETDTTLWCADGSIIFMVAGKRVSVQAGDAIQFPASYSFTAVAGMSGCTMYEANV